MPNGDDFNSMREELAVLSERVAEMSHSLTIGLLFLIGAIATCAITVDTHVLVDASMAPMALAIIGKLFEIKLSASSIEHRFRIINAIEAKQPDQKIAEAESKYVWTINELRIIELAMPWLIGISVALFTIGVWMS